MIWSYVLLAAGLALLVVAGDFLVKGAVSLAERLGISPLVIGLTVVAFGTSAPELFVSVQAAISGQPGIAVGNVVGSNIANVFLVIGLPALIAPVVARQKGIRRNMSAMLILSAVFVWMISDGALSRAEGLTLLAALVAFIIWQLVDARAGRVAPDHDYHEDVGTLTPTIPRTLLYIAIGLIGLPIAAQMSVRAASDIASAFGISEAVIGLTIVAIGTSLPELATTFMAAWRKTGAVAIGNVVGSNIFNLAFIMGLTATIVPIPVDPRIVSVDMWVMLGAAIVLAGLGYGRINAGKAVGALLLLAFAAYIYSFFPGNFLIG